MRLYKYIQKDIQQENIQYQDLVEYNTGSEEQPVYPSKKSIIRNYLDAMDFYTPTDSSYECRYRILTKIINKYYNYELFTDNYEYFGNRMLWRLNKIMPTYRAKFNSLLAQNGYEDIWEDGLLWEHREGTRDTERPEKVDGTPVNFDRTDLADTTTTVGYNSDYPQVIVDSDHDYNATGDKTTTGRTGYDTVAHAMKENVGYGEDITRKFSPEEIAKAKLLFAQLIFNIDEEIVNAAADLFVLVDYPFEDDFDVGIQMSILDDAKAYTNLKFNESKAYTDQEVAKAKEIVYIPYSGTYNDIFTALSNNKLPIYIPNGTDEPKYYYYQEQDLDRKYTFTNGLDWAKCDSNSYWTFGTLVPPQAVEVIYTSNTSYTFVDLAQLANTKLLFVDDNAGISSTYHRIFAYQSLSINEVVFSSVYQDAGIHLICEMKFDFNSLEWTYDSYSIDTTAFYDIDHVTWNDIESAKNSNKTIYLYTELGSGTKQYWYLDAYLPNTNNDGLARFVQIGGNQQFDIDYQDNQSTSETLDVRDLFECTYGTTTYAQITQALNDGKIPFLKTSTGYIEFLVSFTASYYRFASLYPATIYYSSVTNANVWSSGSSGLQRTSNMVTAWQATPDNSHYPSEKLVYDTIQGAVGSGVTSYLLDLDTYAYSSGSYYITIDITSATKYTVNPDPSQGLQWFYSIFSNNDVTIGNPSVSGFYLYMPPSTGKKLILTIYT